MTLTELLDTYNLERSLLLGYYGGGNYGDELLLEVLANLLKNRGVQQMAITYQDPDNYDTFHHDFGYPRIHMRHKARLLRVALGNRNLVVGGGGLWGLDMNLNVFLLSCLLFVYGVMLRKRVFLLGVGYYGSTTRLGRIGAWLAGKSARHIIARDAETLRNFQKITKRVSLDRDIAWHIPELDLSAYQRDAAQLEQSLRVPSKMLLITLRRFKPEHQSTYAALVRQCVIDNPDKPIILSLMEPHAVDPAGFDFIRDVQARHPNVQIADFSYNPLALCMFFKNHHKQLVFVGPQFHAIITAHLAGVPFLPVAYDNKVSQLLEQVDKTPIPLADLRQGDIQNFIDKCYKERG